MRAASIVIAISAALAAPCVHALGFGRVSNGTQLGQPLNFAAAVQLDADETLERECVGADVFSGDNKLSPSQIRVTLEGAANASERVVRITSSALIDEPVMTISVTVGCTSKVTRKFVAFVDPPLVTLAQAGRAVDASMLTPQRVDSPVAPLLGIVQAGAEGASTLSPSKSASSTRNKSRATFQEGSGSRSVARGATPSTKKVAARKESVPRKTVLAARSPLPARAASAGPRLQLETTPVVVARAASGAFDANGVAQPLAAASSPAPDDQALLLERERQRIVVLEDGLARLRTESQANQAAVAALQTRLKEAESERFANPLVYVLAWLSALLIIALAAMVWRQSRARRSDQWWAAAKPAAASAVNGTSTDSLKASRLRDAHSTLGGAFELAAGVDPEPPLPMPLATSRATDSPLPHSLPVKQVRELSVEELIDLEQQAEFFVVLGQDDAAIELLMSHVRSDGGISPMPYLKLLEIYRRLGDHDAYERIRERFNRRFNAYASDWDSDLQQGRSLEGYPDTMDRLVALWSTPARAMETLDTSLFRRNLADQTFDLPAYRELLFLYSIARDLAEHGASDPHSDVDLFLPLADGESIVHPALRSRAARGPVEGLENSDAVTLPLDLDVSFGPSPHPDDASASALRRSPRPSFATDSGFIDLGSSTDAALATSGKS